MQNETRIQAINELLSDKINRVKKESWENIFKDTTLTPPTDSAEFEKSLYETLLSETDAGYRRKENLSAAEKREMGRAASITHLHMNVTAEIGRYIFAVLKWHDYSEVKTAGIEQKGLEDIAEAFNFKIDPIENQLQFEAVEHRRAYHQKEEDREYNHLLRKLIIGGLFATFAGVLVYLRRHT